MRTKEQTQEIVTRLLAEYPEADCTLEYRKPYELLFSVRLAAQCTDERVNMITPALFARYDTPEKLAKAVGERDGHDPFIYKLIYGKRHLHTFVSGLQLFIKVISLHKITVFLVGVKCCSGNLFIIMIRSLRSKTLADVQNHHSSFFT